MRFFPREKGKTAFSKKKPRQRPFSLSRVGKIAISQGVENRGSLISVPLALREKCLGSILVFSPGKCPSPDRNSSLRSRKSGRIFRSEKSQNESFPNFWNFRPGFSPEFCSEFSPNFSRIFRASFHGKPRPKKNSPKIPAIFQCKIPRQTRKKYSQNVSGEKAKYRIFPRASEFC